MATTSAAMAGIKDLLSFSMHETTMKENIYTTMIKVITDEKVLARKKAYEQDPGSRWRPTRFLQ